MEDKDRELSPSQKRMMLVEEIWELAQDESEANAGYAKFLSKCGNMLNSADKDIIKEHMADETQHNQELIEMAIRISGIKAAIG